MANQTQYRPKRMQTKDEKWVNQFKHPSWEAPVVPDILDDVETPKCRKPLSLKGPRSINIVTVKTILPDLVRWRFYAFYACFFSVFDFGPALPPPQGNDSDRGSASKSSASTIIHDQEWHPAKAAREKTLRTAQALFCNLDQRFCRHDLVAIANAFDLEKRRHQRRLKWGLTTTWNLPTFQTILRAAQEVDIPPFQIDIALSLYRAFLDINQHHQSSPITSQLAYEHLGAFFMAQDKRWASLAPIIHEDLRDVCTFSTFSKDERERPDVLQEMSIINSAVSSCSVRYFKHLEQQTLTCHSKPDACTKARRSSSIDDRASLRSPGNSSLATGSPSTGNGDDDTPESRRPSIITTARATLASKLPCKLSGLLAKGGCATVHVQRQVLYTLGDPAAMEEEQEGAAAKSERKSVESPCIAEPLELAVRQMYMVFGHE